MNKFFAQLKSYCTFTRHKHDTPSLANLHDSKRYEYQIEKICYNLKRKSLRFLFDKNSSGIPVFSFLFHKKIVSRYLAHAVRKRTFSFSQGIKRNIINQGHNQQKKIRSVVIFPLIDKIVGGVIAQLLTEIMEPFLSTYCYSYRKGSSPLGVIKKLSHYIQNIRAAEKNTDIFVIKFDIENYSDNIRLDEGSLLWRELHTCFDKLGIMPTPYQWQLLKTCIRPEYSNMDNKLECSIRGVPTGTAITAFLYNFYSTLVDKNASAFPGIFYARYGDDILLAHTDLHVLKNAAEMINQTLIELSLELKESKTFYGCLNLSGYSANPSEWKGINNFNYLGYSLNGYGKYSISNRQQYLFISDIYHKIKSLHHVLKDQPTNDKGKTICQALNKSFGEPKLAAYHTMAMLRETTNHDVLKHMDYLIALNIAKILSGQRGARAFRFIPYKKIRNEWGLQSLLQLSIKRIK